MHVEPARDEPLEPSTKRSVSPRQAAANRRNAQHSTGPRTAEGKNKSRKNALKHGLCAMVLDVPGEDPNVFNTRLQDWNDELNPKGRSVDRYLVSLMTRHSINLDRSFSVQTAKVAQLARDALKDHDEVVAREVEDLLVHLTQTQQYKEDTRGPRLKADYLKIGPPPQPGHAVRRLMTTAQGCQALFDEWELLKEAMIEPPAWDQDDVIRLANLMGASTASRGEVCSPMGVATMDIMEHRRVAQKLKDNIVPGNAPYGQSYSSEAEHQTHRNEIGELSERASLGSSQIRTLIAGQQRMILMHKVEREREEELTRSEATYRARFDASDDGKLFYRYQAEQHRAFIKIVELLKKQARDEEKAAKGQGFASIRTVTPAPEQTTNTTPLDSRNEAIEAPSGNPSKGSKVVESERSKPSPGRRKGQQDRRHRQ
jgi:hypothetical protein